MLSNHVFGFCSSAMSLPIIGQLPVDGTVDRLAVGSAQVVLAVVVVAEALAIYRLFSLWRKDVESDRADRAEERKQFEAIITKNAESNTLRAQGDRELKEAVYHFAEVVKDCDHRKDEG